MSLTQPVRRIPVICNDLGVDIVSETRALQMRRHAPEYVKLKRDKRTRELVAVFLLVPTLTNADWREPHIPATSKTCTKLETLDRDSVYECLECGRNHGGHQRGPHRCFAFKGKVITQEWMGVLAHEMGPLYRTKHL